MPLRARVDRRCRTGYRREGLEDRARRRAGKLQSGASQPGLPADGRFAQTAFNKKGESSDLLGYQRRIFHGQVTTSWPRPNGRSIVRAEVAAAWKADWLNNRARKAAEEIRDAAKGGTPLAELAAEKGLSVEKACRWRAAQQGYPAPLLLEELFKAEVGEIVMGPTADGYAVARLKKSSRLTATSNVEDLKQLQETSQPRSPTTFSRNTRRHCAMNTRCRLTKVP